MSMQQFDIIVIGGGHAGCEAAAVAARMGARVALVSFDLDAIGAMSCNPAIGGLGKGHLVREVDAFDGLIARAADAAAIHYRMLNRSKGSAVWGPRVQADRVLFKAAIQRLLQEQGDLALIAGEASALRLSSGRIAGVDLADGSRLDATAVVLCTGTFLGGTLFRGEERFGAGGSVRIRPSGWRRRCARPGCRWRVSRPGRRPGSTGAQSIGRGLRNSRRTAKAGPCRSCHLAVRIRRCSARSPGRTNAATISSVPTCIARRFSLEQSARLARGIVHQSRTRSTASPIVTAIRYSSSRKGSIRIWSIPTG